MREVFESVAATTAAHPGEAIVIEGVDDELYQAGFEDHPFLLAGVNRVWVAGRDISEEDVREAVGEGAGARR